MQCNESARDQENRELLNEISKNLVFKKVKVSRRIFRSLLTARNLSTVVSVTQNVYYMYTVFEDSINKLVSSLPV